VCSDLDRIHRLHVKHGLASCLEGLCDSCREGVAKVFGRVPEVHFCTLLGGGKASLPEFGVAKDLVGGGLGFRRLVCFAVVATLIGWNGCADFFAFLRNRRGMLPSILHVKTFMCGLRLAKVAEFGWSQEVTLWDVGCTSSLILSSAGNLIGHELRTVLS